MRKKTIGLLSATFALTLSLGIGGVFTAKAQEERTTPIYVENGVAVDGFYMEDGAWIHVDVAGIRFDTVITDAFKTYLQSEYAGATFEWHTLITGVNMLEGGDITKVTPELKKPAWVGANAGKPACQDFNVVPKTIEDVDKDGVNDQTYAAAITYDHLSGEQKAAVSSAELIARSYVKVIQGDTETLIYAKAEDTARDMKGVAYAAIQSGKCEEHKEALYEYTGVTSESVVNNDSSGSFYSLNDESGMITVEGLNATSCEVYYGAKKVSASISGDVVTVNGIDGLVAGEEKEYSLTVFAGGKIYNQPFVCATQVIDEASDLDVFNLGMTNYNTLLGLSDDKRLKLTPQNTGYYVLAGDIDASDYAMQTQGYLVDAWGTENYGFLGTFDGRGYTIQNLTLGNDLAFEGGANTRSLWNKNNYSLFGIIGKGATIKNFALEDVVFDLSSTTYPSLYQVTCAPMARFIVGDARIENVFVKIKGVQENPMATTQATYATVSGFANIIAIDELSSASAPKGVAILKNIIIDSTCDSTDGYIDLNAWKNYSSFANRKRALESVSFNPNTWKNVIVISDKTLTTTVNTNYYDASNVTSEGYAQMPNTYRYETVTDFISANADYTGFGEVWDKSGIVPVWKGQDLTEHLVIELDGKAGNSFELDFLANKEIALSVSANGQEGVTLNSVTVDGDCVTYANEALTVNYPGEATVIANVTYEGQQYDLTATVSVTCEIENYAETVEFSAWHGTLPMADIFGDENAEIVLAYQGNTKLEVKDNKISGLTLSNDKADEIVLTVYSKTKGYNVTCNAYSGIISTAADLEMFNLNMTNYARMAEIANDGDITKELTPTITGYYVLAGDIDASDYAMQTQGFISETYNTFMDDCGFKGTFDGRGYTISGLTFGYDMKLPSATRTYWNKNTYSLFGIISEGGTVKNFALTNVKYDLSNTVGGDINIANCNTVAMWVLNGATVENVYVSTKSCNRFAKDFTRINAFAYGVYVGANLNNILVNDTYTVIAGDGLVDTSGVTNRSSFAYRKVAADGTTLTNNWNNVVVISKFALSVYPTNKYDASNVVSEGYAQMPNTYRYESVTAWETAQADTNVTAKPSVDSFTSYWHTVNGVPAWGKEMA